LIFFNLAGGLGNQMFQYACAKSISLDFDLNVSFCIDSFNVAVNHNGYELERVFGLKLIASKRHDLRSLLGWQANYQIRKLIVGSSLRILQSRQLIVEPSFNYWPLLKSKVKDNVFFHGYWQSPLYFEHHSETIRSEFSFKGSFDLLNKDFAEKISQTNSIGVHVRRGDYLKNKKALEFHGFIGLSYYLDAFKLMLIKYPDAVFFIFSDDTSWVDDNLKTIYPELIVVNHNYGNSSFLDMQLMSMCSHNIIANSTFSWWAAWLNNNKNKTVIAPKQWFANGMSNETLIPNSWITI